MNTYTYAVHVAVFDPFTGQGMIVRPDPADDAEGPTIRVRAGEQCCGYTGDHVHRDSLHVSDWNAAVRHLASLGIVPQEDDEAPFGSIYSHGLTRDGREVLALYGPSIVSQPSIPEMVESHERLAERVGLVS